MKSQVKVLRTKRGWTQEDLARRLGVSRQAVNAIEAERHDPSLDLAFKIATVFGKDIEDVFENPNG